jgi:hypothetical protein
MAWVSVAYKALLIRHQWCPWPYWFEEYFRSCISGQLKHCWCNNVFKYLRNSKLDIFLNWVNDFVVHMCRLYSRKKAKTLSTVPQNKSFSPPPTSVYRVTQRRGILRSLGKPLCRPHWIHYHCPRQSLLFPSARNSGDPHPPPPSNLW